MSEDKASELTLEIAEQLATRLLAINNFKREAIAPIAERLERWCTGTDQLTAVEQAAMLVNEAIDNMAEWRMLEFSAIYDRLFGTETQVALTPEQQAILHPPKLQPVPQPRTYSKCPKCEGWHAQKVNGRYKLCDCPSARQLAYELAEIKAHAEAGKDKCSCPEQDCQHKPTVEKLERLWNGEPLHPPPKREPTWPMRPITYADFKPFGGKK